METSSDKPKRKRIHKRTAVMVFLFVILPWTLISIPGESAGGAGTTGLNITFRKHGWPFTHLHSTQYDLYGNWVNGKFIQGKPTNVDTKPKAIKSHNNHFNDSIRAAKWLEFDLRLKKQIPFSSSMDIGRDLKTGHGGATSTNLRHIGLA